MAPQLEIIVSDSLNSENLWLKSFDCGHEYKTKPGRTDIHTIHTSTKAVSYLWLQICLICNAFKYVRLESNQEFYAK